MTHLQKSTAPMVNPFAEIRHLHPDTGEFWSARELQPLLGYEKWQTFEAALDRAVVTCQNSGQSDLDHFTAARKLINAGKGAQQTILDYPTTSPATPLTWSP